MTTERDEAVRVIEVLEEIRAMLSPLYQRQAIHRAIKAIAALRDGEGCGTCGGRGWIDEGHLEDDGRMVSAPEDCPDCTPPAKQPEAQAVAWEFVYCNRDRMVWFDKPPSGGDMDKVFSNVRPLIYGDHPTTPAVGGGDWKARIKPTDRVAVITETKYGRGIWFNTEESCAEFCKWPFRGIPPVEPRSEGVTDEMVERIGNAHGVRSYTCDASGRNVQHTAWRFTRDELKAALEAAFATKPAKE